ncbi:hypothetical protein ABPG74_020310 [Tetrahymena malaccensis]
MSEKEIQNKYEFKSEFLQQIKDFLSVNKYSYLKEIGSNYYSKIIYAYQLCLKQNFIIKIVLNYQYENMKFRSIKDMITEYSKLLEENKYYFQIYEQIEDPKQQFFGFVYDYQDCNLANILDSNQFSLDQVVYLTKQLLESLAAFQIKNIIHKNIKPENILFNKSENRFVIVDYVVSHIFDEILSQKTKSLIGFNITYKAPELIGNQKSFSIKSDVFSIGLIITEAFLKRRLQAMEHIHLKLSSLKDGMYQIDQADQQKFLEQVLFKMVEPDENQRLDPFQLLQILQQFSYTQYCLEDLNIESQLGSVQINQIGDIINIHQCENVDIILKNKNITVEGANTISSSLINCQNLTSLNLDLQTNQIGAEGAKYLRDGMQQLKKLTLFHLNLSENNIQHNGATFIGQGLSFLHQIRDLKLNLCDNKIESQGIKGIASNLQGLKLIEYLDINLDCNNILSEGVIFLINYIENNINIKSLQLSLYQNNISGEATQYISKYISKLNNLTYLNINLCDNQILDLGANCIGNGLNKLRNLKILHLNLSKNNIQHQGASNLFNGLSKCTNIEDLNLSLKNNSVYNDGVKSFIIALRNLNNLSSLKLDLCKCKIGSSFLVNLAPVFSKLIQISNVYLDLRFNDLAQIDIQQFNYQIQKLEIKDIVVQV